MGVATGGVRLSKSVLFDTINFGNKNHFLNETPLIMKLILLKSL